MSPEPALRPKADSATRFNFSRAIRVTQRRRFGSRLLGMLWIALATLALALAGCVSKKTQARNVAQAAIQSQQLSQAEEQRKTTVWIRGNVVHRLVRWSQDLTLSRAIIEAQYLGSRDPRTIQITRGDARTAVDPRRLLKGLDDLPLQAGDIIDIQ